MFLVFSAAKVAKKDKTEVTFMRVFSFCVEKLIL